MRAKEGAAKKQRKAGAAKKQRKAAADSSASSAGSQKNAFCTRCVAGSGKPKGHKGRHLTTLKRRKGVAPRANGAGRMAQTASDRSQHSGSRGRAPLII